MLGSPVAEERERKWGGFETVQGVTEERMLVHVGMIGVKGKAKMQHEGRTGQGNYMQQRTEKHFSTTPSIQNDLSV